MFGLVGVTINSLVLILIETYFGVDYISRWTPRTKQLIFSFSIMHLLESGSEAPRTKQLLQYGKPRKTVFSIPNCVHHWPLGAWHSPFPNDIFGCVSFNVGIWENYMGVSKNRGTPKSSNLIGFSHYKPSILGYQYFWKHPYMENDYHSCQNDLH